MTPAELVPQLQTKIELLTEALTTIDNWLVCSCLATPEDMAGSFGPMHELIQQVLTALEDDHEPGND